MNKPLDFIIGQEFVPVVETADQFGSSLFSEVYRKALRVIEELVEYRTKEEVNNIIAFVGERGSGKSSCMRSVAEVLGRGEMGKCFPGEFEKVTKNHRFYTFDIIDPGFFEKDNNILQLVIGKLFKTFKEKVEYADRERALECDYQDKKRRLVDIFERVYRNLEVLFNRRERSNESLDALLDLSASYELHQNIGKLVSQFLDFMKGDSDVLVLQIDDIDLQTLHAYDMVEQIRKYMMHPNVVVLMAVRIVQLGEVIMRQYVEEFRPLLDKEYMAKESVEEMSERYLGKLIPHERRLFLPDMEVNFNAELRIYSSEESWRKNKSDQERGTTEIPKDYIVFNSVREAVLTLIYRKTRFLFYNSKGATSYIVPRNLREMRSIIRLLFNMSDFRSLEERPQYNKVLFQKYFFDTWLKSHLDVKDERIVREIWEVDTSMKNKLLVQTLYEQRISKGNDPDDYSWELAFVQNPENRSYNVSAGDALGVLYLRDSQNVNLRKRKFIFAIRTIYSMLLYRYYDEITDRDAEVRERVLKENVLDEYSNYDILAGGSLINPLLHSLVPSKLDGHERVQARVYMKAVNNIVEKLKKSEKLTEADVKRLRFVEFVVLNITRKFWSKNGDEKNIYRRKDEVTYATITKEKDMFFEATGFTANLAHVDELYDLFGLSGVSMKKDVPSLYNQILSEIFGPERMAEFYDCKDVVDEYEALSEGAGKEARKGAYDEALAKFWNFQAEYKSTVCFRNSEVLDNFIDHIRARRTKTGDDVKVLQFFYETASTFSIKTYDEREGFPNYEIKFAFLRYFKEAIEKIDEGLWGSVIEFVSATERITKKRLNFLIKASNPNLHFVSDVEVLIVRRHKDKDMFDQEKFVGLLHDLFSDTKVYTTAEANELLSVLTERYYHG